MLRQLKSLALIVFGSLASVAVISNGIATPDPQLAPASPQTAATQKPAAPAAPPPQQPFDYSIILGEERFDLALGQPAAPIGWGDIQHEGDDLHLIQFTGPIQQAWINALEARNLRVLQYLHPYTYIVWGQTAQRLAAFNAIPTIRAAGSFSPAYRVLPQFRNLNDDIIDISLYTIAFADADGIAQTLRDLHVEITGHSALADDPFLQHFTIKAPGSILQQLAHIPGVYTIQPQPTDGGLRGEMSAQINVGNYNGSNQAFPGYMAWLNSVALNGSGVRIAVVDGGVQTNHPNLAARMVPCSGSTCSGGASSHGTHCAGIMAADNSSGVLDAFGFARGMGVAPGAQLVAQNYSPTFTQAGGMLELMKQSYANGALLSGNSWGPAGTPRGYDGDTRQTDVGVRDTNAAIPGDQHLSYILSIMNGNGSTAGGAGTQGTPDEAKNLFTIGSTKMQNTNGSQILQINDVSANSAHGPCLDGRKIPHAVAPGCNVDSTDTTSTHSLKCGTSMASPQVSGAVALFIQYYRSLPDFLTDPSPALVKAAFLPVCYDLAGNLDADNGVMGHPFDTRQGWGRMNLTAVVNPPAFSVRYFDQQHLFNNTGEEWATSLSPLDPSKPMRMMLVWTDAPGHGLGGATPAWNNDLDLVVEGNFGSVKGNVFGANGFSITGGVKDDRNNTEGVFLPAGSGPVTVRVIAANINSDGCPNVGDSTDQDFALVVYNAALEPGFTVQASPAQQTVCAPAQVSVTVDVGQILGFTDPVTLSVAGGLPAGMSGGFAVNPVTPAAITSLDLTLSAGVSAGVHEVQIVGTSGDVVRSATVSVNISTQVPVTPVGSSPANGTQNVSVTPTLVWSSSAQTSQYEVEVSLNSGFTNVVYTGNSATASHTVGSPLATDTLHWWRVRASNICGTSSYSAAMSFRTLDVPPILLVDDDDNSPDVRSFYTNALAGLGVNYDVFNVNNGTSPGVEPTFAQMAPYKIIIWFSGDAFSTSTPKAGPTAATEPALAQWLDAGGCLFLSSQDYCYDRLGGTSGTTANPFMQNYLGFTTIAHDQGYTAINAGQNVFTGYGPYTLNFAAASGGPGMSNFSDRITVNANGQVAFSTAAGPTAATRDGGVYRSATLLFPLEAVPTLQARTDILSRVINWCSRLNPPAPVCVADTNDDGQVGVPDLLMCISGWGPCPAPPDACPADISPEGGDGTVGVPDLLTILGAWGPCPQ